MIATASSGSETSLTTGSQVAPWFAMRINAFPVVLLLAAITLVPPASANKSCTLTSVARDFLGNDPLIQAVEEFVQETCSSPANAGCNWWDIESGKVCVTISYTVEPAPMKACGGGDDTLFTCWIFEASASAQTALQNVGLSGGGGHITLSCSSGNPLDPPPTVAVGACTDAATAKVAHDKVDLFCSTITVTGTGLGFLGGSTEESASAGPGCPPA